MRVCFVCPYAYSLFQRSTRYPFGGSEVRCWLLGTGLATRPAHEVSFVVFDHGQKRCERYGQVAVYRHSFYRSLETKTFMNRTRAEVFAALKRTDRFPFWGFKEFRPGILLKTPLVLAAARWARLTEAVARLYMAALPIGEHEVPGRAVRVYRDVGADVYAVFGVTELAAEVIAYCRAAGKRAVLFLGSDIDLSEAYYPGSRERSPYGNRGSLCHYALMQADLIITQTGSQSRLLRERFGRTSTTIANPIELSGAPEAPVACRPGARSALWIGKADTIKRPEVLLQLAQVCPEVRFTMVMNRSDPAIFDRIHRDRPPNVDLREYVPVAEIEALFAQAFALVNTARLEGFPNTFLQAGKFGVPILSLEVDPDGFIEKAGCGIAAGGRFERLVEGLSILARRGPEAAAFSDNLWRHVRAHHRLKDRVDELDRAFQGSLHV